ncbi:MAG: hypothetical protein UT55_C0051G0001 [Candidatus Peregrinibacteria bacterium GW2011_GWE2_39_6]|nr:MAG: hypothetical protein UT36_C0012G0017 [Candidatus Peregrinibacteria bacterium GW2011_GWF2_39_17]KKR24941.1 MAG: hypothetical protein UT55_C0051G0001 [Candidatus Peregrinibacteria bacterium GW2011_GWE2_39_6]
MKPTSFEALLLAAPVFLSGCSFETGVEYQERRYFGAITDETDRIVDRCLRVINDPLSPVLEENINWSQQLWLLNSGHDESYDCRCDYYINHWVGCGLSGDNGSISISESPGSESLVYNFSKKDGSRDDKYFTVTQHGRELADGSVMFLKDTCQSSHETGFGVRGPLFYKVDRNELLCNKTLDYIRKRIGEVLDKIRWIKRSEPDRVTEKNFFMSTR